MRRIIVIAAAAAALAACGKARIDTPMAYTKPAPTSHGGHHKTGKPYEIAGRWYYPLQSARGYDQTGTASWYGPKFHGHLTANGERYDMHAMSAAHKTLPLPTLVRVTNLENGRQVVVRVNDRGPFVKNRLIDLSYAAAQALGFDGQGTTRVRVQTLDGAAPERYVASSRPVRTPAPRPVAPVPAAVPTTMPERPRAVRTAAPGGKMYVQLGAFSSPANAQRLQRSLVTHYPGVRIFEPSALRPRMYRVRIGPIDDVKHIEKLMLSLQHDGYGNAIVVIE